MNDKNKQTSPQENSDYQSRQYQGKPAGTEKPHKQHRVAKAITAVAATGTLAGVLPM